MAPRVQWPEWWEWEVEFAPHLHDRMITRHFNEADIRVMLEDALSYEKDKIEGRYAILTRWERQDWKIVVEPDFLAQQLVVITAFLIE